MDEVLIRELGTDEWKTKRDLRLAALLDAPQAFGGNYADSAARSPSQWRQWPGDHVVFGAYLDGEPVGIAATGGDPLNGTNLIAMWVAPDARGHRIAGRLIEAVAAVAAAHCDWLWLEVKPDNDNARRAYERCGFVVVADAAVSEPGNLAMRLPLDR